jgi:dTDP-4-dehydrorhamnose reductase
VRIAVTGAGGRLGSALVAELIRRPPRRQVVAVESWARPSLDLDRPETLAHLVRDRRPDLVLHCAAWTDVDGCAREPTIAMRRNGEATAVLAAACRRAGADLLYVSTNEVFDGRRTDGRGYAPDDPTTPASAYGASKLAGEQAARDALWTPGAVGGATPQGGDGGPNAVRDGRSGGGRVAIVRTAWLFGPGEPDFPSKILAAARHAEAAGEVLRAVGDEWGNPTYTKDLARAIISLVGTESFAGVHHVVNGLFATRSQWALYVVGRAGLDVRVEEVPASTWTRASTPPRWGVLAPTPLPEGPMRAWPDAMADYAPDLLAA